ncbi:hypothetical protein F4167_19105 [Candidatus Poribacteria bacterium]|nr:hypothetical protein [Candidatus Poribacteria bacterium]
MFGDLLSSRWFQGGFAFFVLCVGGSLLYSWHVHRTTESDMARHDRLLLGREKQNETHPAESVNVPTDTETPGFVYTPDENTDTPRSEDPSTSLVDDAENVGLTDVSSTRKTVQTSSNPLFADGVPEHLQCPENLIGVYARELPTEELLKIYNIQLEVMANYNPNRRLAEVWPQFIEEERGYHANADPMQMMPGTSAGRLDWSVQIILDFPEVLVIAEEDPERFSDMRMVEIGEYSPDWNLHTLPDGREFRTATGYWYEFSLTSEDGLTGRTRGIGHSGRDAQLVEINLNETSDEELKRLEGWNYNINPYTTGIYK